MARNIKITWPAIGKPYRGFITKMRQCLDEVYDFTAHSPKAKPAVRAKIEAFATAQRINSGQVVTPVVVTGTGTTATFTVAGGKVTAIALTA